MGLPGQRRQQRTVNGVDRSGSWRWQAAAAVALVGVAAFVCGASWTARRAEARLARLEAAVGRLAHDGDANEVAADRAPSWPGFRLTTLTDASPEADVHAALAASIKAELQDEMGLLPIPMVRERRESFVELYVADRDGVTYGTAGYIGGRSFLTVKHAVGGPGERARGTIKLRIAGRDVAAAVVDAGDASAEVDPGDWAVLEVDEPPALRALRVDLDYGFPFADPIVRMGNDYSKGILATTSHVGQRRNGLVTCLTDGHPGVSGGGVLDRQGSLVGIQVGRLEGDYRFSFILPVRAEMFRRVPGLLDRWATGTSPAERARTPREPGPVHPAVATAGR